MKGIVIGYLVLANVIAFFLMGNDKRRARQRRYRIPEKVLFLWAAIGGSLGAIVGMRYFHHKTKHWYFVIGMPLLLVLQVAIGIWLYIM